jgi:hypothetical protein
MKAVAAALLLIVGAAVVLWYGNTLNSWVLGGLIGGLAALLLSIPISLVLFSYLSRRHDERLGAQAEEEPAFALARNVQDAPRLRRAYEVEGYALSEADEAYPRQIEQPARNLPALSSQRLPMATQRPTNRASAKQSARKAPIVSTKETNGRRTTGRMNYPGFPSYEPGSFHSQHRLPAMRTAQREAARQSQYDHEDVEVLPTRVPKRLPPAHADEEMGEQDWQPTTRRSSREQQQRTGNHPQARSRRTIDAAPSQSEMHRSLPPAGGSTTRSSRYEEPDTDYLYPRSSQTDQLYPRTSAPRTDQIARSRRRDEQSRPPETITGSIQKPLVRRAPYVYNDDPLYQQLARQVDAPPAVRRSSRSLESDEEDL